MNLGVLLIVLGIALAMFLHSALGALLVLVGALLLIIPELKT